MTRYHNHNKKKMFSYDHMIQESMYLAEVDRQLKAQTCDFERDCKAFDTICASIDDILKRRKEEIKLHDLEFAAKQLACEIYYSRFSRSSEKKDFTDEEIDTIRTDEFGWYLYELMSGLDGPSLHFRAEPILSAPSQTSQTYAGSVNMTPNGNKMVVRYTLTMYDWQSIPQVVHDFTKTIPL